MKWHTIGKVSDFESDLGVCAKIGSEQIAIFNIDKKDWYAVQNRCPHENQMVLSRGILGDCKGEPKVACPLHKNQFSLKDGRHLGGNEEFKLKTYKVELHGDEIRVEA